MSSKNVSSDWFPSEIMLAQHESAIERAIIDVEDLGIIPRIWAHDHTVWSSDPTEISNRLGWLISPHQMLENLSRLKELVVSVRGSGFKHAVLLGMGGSSLAPELFWKTFGAEAEHMDLRVLDSTDPRAVKAMEDDLDLQKTLFIVATKSGGTVETLSFFKYFYNKVSHVVGENQAGEHFIAITDPGSALQSISEKYRFREIFLNDPNIGGRYSALTFFGLVPAALIGVDIDRLLQKALTAMAQCDPSIALNQNPAVMLGLILGELSKLGRDKLTLVTSDRLSSFGDWVEQLIAESTGKDGMGILPVVGEDLGSPQIYGNDRTFVYLRLVGDHKQDSLIHELRLAGFPTVTFDLADVYDLAGHFFIWELATAVASQRLNINPFDQPNVEAAKILAREKVKEFESAAGLGDVEPSFEDEGLEVYDLGAASGKSSEARASSAQEALEGFLALKDNDSYVALQAYLQPTEEIKSGQEKLRSLIRAKTKLATTMGFGPRYLHSTGQLHKGDRGNGLFIQFTSSDPIDLPIPDEAGSAVSTISFGILKSAQAEGDRQALLNSKRKVLRFHFTGDVLAGLEKIISWMN
jgi:glucose-6-phosphate isomerase